MKKLVWFLVFLLLIALVIIGMYATGKLAPVPSATVPIVTTSTLAAPAPAATKEAAVKPKKLYSGTPVVMNFVRKGHSPSEYSVDLINRMSRDLGGKVSFKIIDVDKNPETSAFYNLNAVPALIITDDSGDILFKREGFTSEKIIIQQLRKLGLDI